MTLDEPAALTFPEWGQDPVKSGITLRMLLEGTSGLAGGRDMTGAEARALAPRAPPGSRFIDDPAALLIFLEAAKIKLFSAGRTADPALYVSERVLTPIGCAPVEWRRNEAGESSLVDGAALSARAWAQWGELMRRVGVWRARELIAGSALRDACRGSWLQPRYGFGLWLAWPAPPQTPVFQGSDLWSSRFRPPLDLVMAASARGDRLFVLPTQRMVIARQAREANDWSDAELIRLTLLEA
jgi:CubicO group peptidase (beta-lactamase class C family)